MIVLIYPDGTSAINHIKQNGTTDLSKSLLEIFTARIDNGVYSDKMRNRDDVPDSERIERTVWILATSNLKADVVNEVVKAVKLAGASPVKMLKDARYQKFLAKPPSGPEVLSQRHLIQFQRVKENK